MTLLETFSDIKFRSDIPILWHFIWQSILICVQICGHADLELATGFVSRGASRNCQLQLPGVSADDIGRRGDEERRAADDGELSENLETLT